MASLHESTYSNGSSYLCSTANASHLFIAFVIEGEELMAHKDLLMQKSEYFRNLVEKIDSPQVRRDNKIIGNQSDPAKVGQWLLI